MLSNVVDVMRELEDKIPVAELKKTIAHVKFPLGIKPSVSHPIVDKFNEEILYKMYRGNFPALNS